MRVEAQHATSKCHSTHQLPLGAQSGSASSARDASPAMDGRRSQLSSLPVHATALRLVEAARRSETLSEASRAHAEIAGRLPAGAALRRLCADQLLRAVVCPLACCVSAFMVVLTLFMAVCIDSLFLEAAPSLTPLALGGEAGVLGLGVDAEEHHRLRVAPEAVL
eukprot:CAMPEP_0115868990 /NCGR_PEP_ID=MMETSP0287-20121206/21578_1 /TAXON_ID=412157 /ORGANISM="Chrysochromulina rotalis, Strain UIO044" /LENGTH=164 /DNA_ID=CAMNT_0003323663 /DNA_START=301 /DNA_END=794 /DNA_ORIENTATION=+